MKARDGRRFVLRDPAAVIAAFREGEVDLPIDHEHQADRKDAARTCPVPAAGWIKDLKSDRGALWGRVEWTAAARSLIEAREYRFLSPSFFFDPRVFFKDGTGDVTRLAALLDLPARGDRRRSPGRCGGPAGRHRRQGRPRSAPGRACDGRAGVAHARRPTSGRRRRPSRPGRRWRRRLPACSSRPPCGPGRWPVSRHRSRKLRHLPRKDRPGHGEGHGRVPHRQALPGRGLRGAGQRRGGGDLRAARASPGVARMMTSGRVMASPACLAAGIDAAGRRVPPVSPCGRDAGRKDSGRQDGRRHPLPCPAWPATGRPGQPRPPHVETLGPDLAMEVFLAFGGSEVHLSPTGSGHGALGPRWSVPAASRF